MTHSQMSRAARARHKELLKGAARGSHSEDPLLRRMLASHMHCGEPMQLLRMDPARPDEGYAGRNDGGPLTYRCACGFSFDQRQD